MTTKERGIYERALKSFGMVAQVHMCSEEMSELNKVLMKILRNGINDQSRLDLIDELADVRVMVDQMEQVFAVELQVEARKQEKLDRLVRILDDFDKMVSALYELEEQREA